MIHKVNCRQVWCDDRLLRITADDMSLQRRHRCGIGQHEGGVKDVCCRIGCDGQCKVGCERTIWMMFPTMTTPRTFH